METFIDQLLRGIGGRYINKALTAAASFLVSHHLLSAGQETSWVQSNGDLVLGGLLAIVSIYFTHVQHTSTQVQVTEAHAAGVASTQPNPPMVTAGGGVGMSATTIGGN